jgi:hypothetical protein
MPEPTERRREDEPVRGRTATVSPAGRPAEETYRLEVRLTDYEPGVPGLAVRWVPEPPPEPALGQVVEMVFEQHVSNEDLPQGVVPLARIPTERTGTNRSGDFCWFFPGFSFSGAFLLVH